MCCMCCMRAPLFKCCMCCICAPLAACQHVSACMPCKRSEPHRLAQEVCLAQECLAPTPFFAPHQNLIRPGRLVLRPGLHWNLNVLLNRLSLVSHHVFLCIQRDQDLLNFCSCSSTTVLLSEFLFELIPLVGNAFLGLVGSGCIRVE